MYIIENFIFQKNYSLIISSMYTMKKNHLIFPFHPVTHSRHVLLSSSMSCPLCVCPTKSTQCCSCESGSIANPWNTGNLPVTTSPKKSVLSPQPVTAGNSSSVGVGPGQLLLCPCWNFDCLSFLGQEATDVMSSWVRQLCHVPKTAFHTDQGWHPTALLPILQLLTVFSPLLQPIHLSSSPQAAVRASCLISEAGLCLQRF